jgi:hypothetical protein
MNNGPSFFLVFVIEFVFVVVWMTFAVHHARSFTARGVVKRLRKWDDQPLIMRVPWLGGSWNPGKPEKVQYQLVGPGRAVYRLAGDHEVKVDYSPRWGKAQRFSGPIPPYVDATPHRRLHPLARRILAGYVLFLCIGALIGGLVAHGSVSDHGTGAVIGFMIAALVASFAATALVGVRSFTHQSKVGPSKPAVKATRESVPGEDVWKRVDRNERIARRYLEEHEHPHMQ